MKIIVLTNDALKEELLSQGLDKSAEIKWLYDLDSLNEPADACIDLLFTNEPKRIESLKKILPGIVLINSVDVTLKNFPDEFIRFNGWPTFLSRPVAEAAFKNEIVKIKAEKIFNYFNKKTEWTEDIPGFVTARIVAMIINEAFFALGEGVSTKQEIDTAMKLGTNYPYGPFEWSEKIGLKKIVSLLNELKQTDKRYEPAERLKKETTA